VKYYDLILLPYARIEKSSLWNKKFLRGLKGVGFLSIYWKIV
jgi:hypothetical protein